MSKLSLSCSSVEMNLSTIDRSLIKQSSIVNFTVDSVNHDFTCDFKSIFVVNSIPGIPYKINVNLYPYLYSLDLVDNFDGHIDVLIGQDYASCFMPIDVYRGSNDEPYAVRTPLGYTINGLHPLCCVNQSIVSNFITTSTCTIDNDIHRLWELDQCDVSDGLSVDDNHVISMWDNKCRFFDGHWEVPIPWKDNVSALLNNYHQAKARLISLQSSLIKKSMFNVYDKEVRKLLVNKYAEYAPDCSTPNKTWYIPHHCVPKKNNKIRLVFDCACKYNDMSLNSTVYQGHDLITRLQYVLLRFRQHQYAVTADIESMYCQIRVPTCDRDALRFLWFENGIIKQFRMTLHLFGGVWCSSSAGYALRKSVQFLHVILLLNIL